MDLIPGSGPNHLLLLEPSDGPGLPGRVVSVLPDALQGVITIANALKSRV